MSSMRELSGAAMYQRVRHELFVDMDVLVCSGCCECKVGYDLGVNKCKCSM